MNRGGVRGFGRGGGKLDRYPAFCGHLRFSQLVEAVAVAFTSATLVHQTLC